MINSVLDGLANYGIEKNLISSADKVYVINRFLEILQLDSFQSPEKSSKMTLEEMLNIVLEDSINRGVIEDSIIYKDLLDTRIMGAMTPFPSEVHRKFDELYCENPIFATDWYYNFSCDTDYIRRYRIEKDVKWVTKSKYGDLDITINLAKPEKDPKAIAAAKNIPASGNSYPKCMLCKENEGARGSVLSPARQNHRIIPIEIANSNWFFQYSPYVYYNEHCIAFSSEHSPMKIDKTTFAKMMDFVKIFNHYFVGSNADLPIVGGSILSHDHFQGGRYTFAMENASILSSFQIKGFEEVSVEILNWPMSVIRISHEDSNTLVELADKILCFWREYNDEEAFVFSHTGEEPHNTITPIGRKKDDKYQIDLVLRNNITTKEHPLGVYHPHEQLHHIKKENIGLIEVMGLAVLPSRLKEELAILRNMILNGEDISDNHQTSKHKNWVLGFLPNYDSINEKNIDGILKQEVGKVFEQVLEDAGVFKLNEPGFEKFMTAIGGQPLLIKT